MWYLTFRIWRSRKTLLLGHIDAKPGIAKLSFWCISIQYTVFWKRSYFKETLRWKKKKDFLAANSQICHLVVENQHLNYQLLHLLSSKRTSFEYALFDLTCKKTFLHCCTAHPTQEQCKQFCSKSQVCIEQIMLLKEIVSPNHCCTVGCSSLNIQKYFVRGAEYN